MKWLDSVTAFVHIYIGLLWNISCMCKSILMHSSGHVVQRLAYLTNALHKRTAREKKCALRHVNYICWTCRAKWSSMHVNSVATKTAPIEKDGPIHSLTVSCWWCIISISQKGNNFKKYRILQQMAQTWCKKLKISLSQNVLPSEERIDPYTL